MRTAHQVTFSVQVYDLEALKAAAVERAVAEGISREDAIKDMEDADACLLMMLDPGHICMGASIISSHCEEVPE